MYSNPSKLGPAESSGRSILNSRDAVVVIPKAPLRSGARYTVSLTVNGITYNSSYTIAARRRRCVYRSRQRTQSLPRS